MEAFDRNDSAGMRLRQSVVARLVEVGQRIDHASQKAGRGQARVTVVAVTKSLSLGAIPFLSGLGLAHFAENRPQELARRAPLLPTASWHMIGHIQRNKAAQTTSMKLTRPQVQFIPPEKLAGVLWERIGGSELVRRWA